MKKSLFQRLNLRNWTLDGCKMNNPAVILWRSIMIPFYTVALLVFCVVSYISDWDFDHAVKIYKNYGIGL